MGLKCELCKRELSNISYGYYYFLPSIIITPICEEYDLSFNAQLPELRQEFKEKKQ